MADCYYGKCGSCVHLNWKDCSWTKFQCTARPGRYYLALEPIDGCKYFESNHLSDEQIEKLRLENLR